MKKLMMFTKPFDDKDWCVKLYYYSETQKFDVCGIDAFGEEFEYSYYTLDRAKSRFYFKLCYILNAEVMAKTVCQRIDSSYRQDLKSNLKINK